MSILRAKVQAEHLARQAYIYVRQSSMTQVYEHQESTRRQYELQARARQLGWTDERIVVMDEDLGQSASDAHLVRAGFQKLLADMVLGQVGGIVSLEVSRLARQDSEGHRLVEVAALMGTLLISSSRIVPPSANRKRPTRSRVAPVKAPRTWPKSSLSSSVSVNAAQSTLTNGLFLRSEL